ncbi:MAG TPA: ABC transporter substrate-binding protein [Solirubrobacteraceae bacterium]|nr:ABC transporter substrate-binding protein [Solirubrobacteraceae bacterium]
MRKHFGWRVRIPVALLVVAVGLTIVTSSFGNTTRHAARTAAALNCGAGTGQKATGTPIPLGAIVTNQPGTSFTDITSMAQAYFTCVNDNGGINGHPIQYTVLQEQTQAPQVAAEANQLINTDHVVGIVGNTSIIDCAVNGATYAKAGFNLIDAGIASQCYASPWSATVNMGPRYSGDGAAQAAILHGAKTIVVDQSNVPGYQSNAAGIVLIGKQHHVKIVQLAANAASINGETEAERIVQAAGPHGAADLIFTPPVALQILQGAQKLNLINKVIWTCATPCNTDFLAKALGPAWNHKLFVNAEMNEVRDDNGPDTKLYLSVLKNYGQAVSGGIGSFSQFGFVVGQLTVQALMSIKNNTYTVQTVNAAIRGLKGFKTDMLCKPWYYGNAPVHLPNNTDYTVWPANGVMHIVPGSGCLPIDPVDPVVAQVRAIEKKQGL